MDGAIGIIFICWIFSNFKVASANSLNYQVVNISCEYSSEGANLRARISRPSWLLTEPVFAEARHLDPSRDSGCRMVPDEKPRHFLLFYSLSVTDIRRCGGTKQNGLFQLRVWFPQLSGMITRQDEEVTIRCRPRKQPSSNQQTDSSFAQLTKSHQSYTIRLFASSPEKHARAISLNDYNLPVKQPVAMGTRLMFTISATSESVWRYFKLLEVTVSSEKDNPYSPDHVMLVKDSCRNPGLSSIVLTQPMRNATSPNQVFIILETFLLELKNQQTMAFQDGSAQLWIHSKVQACVREDDCLEEFCLDMDHPNSFGRRRRKKRATSSGAEDEKSAVITSTRGGQELTTFGDNVGLKVKIPPEVLRARKIPGSPCSALTVLVAVLASFLLITCSLMCVLAIKLQRMANGCRVNDLDDLLYRHMQHTGAERSRIRKLHHLNLSNPHYTRTLTASATSSDY